MVSVDYLWNTHINTCTTQRGRGISVSRVVEFGYFVNLLAQNQKLCTSLGYSTVGTNFHVEHPTHPSIVNNINVNLCIFCNMLL